MITLVVTTITLLSSASIALADEGQGTLRIETTTISEGFYSLAFRVKQVTDMAGFSIDMEYDTDTYRVTDQLGNPITEPMIPQEVFLTG